MGCSETDEEIQSDEEMFTEDEVLIDDEEISDETDISDDQTSIVNPIIYSGVHDPAQLIEINDQLVLFASAVEWSIYNFSSSRWELKGDDIYIDGNPEWYSGTGLWAPSIFENDENDFKLYHSAVSDEDSHELKIGFAQVDTNSSEFSFTPSTDYVLESENTEQPFAIDPAVFKDDDNRVWLVYGSHAKGIWITELDQTTGLLKTDPNNKTWNSSDSRFIEIANYGGQLDENNIEAAYVYNHPENEYYYLFVNWDECCNGINSTYNVRMGRSTSPTGPFLDKNGNDLASGGGTLFLDTNGVELGDDRFVGPGHIGIFHPNESDYYISHHFYDKDNNGEASLAIWHLKWNDDWPQVDTEKKVEL
jgi:arabinan endo-1,5-alpha-L-arabinosidase